MINRIVKYIFVCATLFSLEAVAERFPDRPSPHRLVNDFTHTLSGNESEALEAKLREFNNRTSTQIAIVIVRSLGGEDIDLYAAEMGQKWEIGQKGKDNGALILVALDDRKVSIQLGYGLEGVAPDILVNQIIKNDIVPNFKQGNYYEGLEKGSNSLMDLAKGEFTLSTKNSKQINWISYLFPLFIVIVFLLIRMRGARKYSYANDIPFWTTWALMNAGNSRSRGSWGNFSSGGGSFGGGSSFGGFGGGSFGGGGSSGSW